jgi:hypothetical protein
VHNQLRALLLSAFLGAAGLFHRRDGTINLTFLARFMNLRHAR